jgi:glycine cleavage system transcriptional repressor
MPQDFVVSVMALDRVGIVAGLTDAIVGLQGNIDAISQTVLQGYFTIIVTVHFDEERDAGALAEAIRRKGRPGELEVSIQERRVTSPAPVVKDAERFILSILGPDRKGIIYRVSSYLASRNINIEDLYAYVAEKAFVLVAQIQLPPELEVERVKLDVEALWPASDMRVSLQHENIFLATNDVDFRQALP